MKKMESNWNLSEKIKQARNDDFSESGLLLVEDVKEFIRLESELISKRQNGEISFMYFLNKRAELLGEKLK